MNNPAFPNPTPPPAASSPAPRPGARNDADRPRPDPAPVRPSRPRRQERNRLDAGQLPAQRRSPGRRGRRRRSTWACAPSSSSASPAHKDATGSSALRRRRHRAAGPARPSRGLSPGRPAHHRRVLLRIHRPRPLRRARRVRAAGCDVDNDATLPLLAQQCVSHARAGADMVAPSGMLDGMVGAIRTGSRRGRLLAGCRS